MEAMDHKAMLEARAGIVWADFEEEKVEALEPVKSIPNTESVNETEVKTNSDGETYDEEADVSELMRTASPLVAYDVKLERLKFDFMVMKFEKDE